MALRAWFVDWTLRARLAPREAHKAASLRPLRLYASCNWHWQPGTRTATQPPGARALHSKSHLPTSASSHSTGEYVPLLGSVFQTDARVFAPIEGGPESGSSAS
jgi:hypothetical protein